MSKSIKPEKITEQQCLEYCMQVGIDVDIIDSKATYSLAKKSYTKSKSVPEGFSDLVGNTSSGVAVFIELKAKGKLKTLREKQYYFLMRKIHSGCFACAVDSAEMLHDIYVGWLGSQDKVSYLESQLKKPKSIFCEW